MTAVMCMPAGMAVGWGVAAADLPAGHAHPKVNPAAPAREALLAACDRGRKRR